MTGNFRAHAPVLLVFSIVASAMLVSVPQVSAADPLLLIADETADVTCRLTTDAKTYRRGQNVTITWTISNRGPRFVCYNPFLDRDLVNCQSASLRVFRADGTYLCDLLSRSLVLYEREPGPADFVSIPHLGEVGGKKHWTALKFTMLPQYRHPGKYRLQLSFDSRFRSQVQGQGAAGILSNGDVPSQHDLAVKAMTAAAWAAPKSRDALVSNFVEIEILEADPAADVDSDSSNTTPAISP